jgi:hypothetical protein
MELRSVNGSPLFRMVVNRYEFPDAAGVGNDPWDINWLDVKCHFDTADFTWNYSEPCLTTGEARELADWLDRVAAQSPGVQAEIDGSNTRGDAMVFTEPNLGFSVLAYPTDQSAVIRVHVSFVSLDPANLGAWQDGIYTSHVDVEMTCEALSAAAAGWRAELAAYPIR